MIEWLIAFGMGPGTCFCATNGGTDAFELLSQHFSNGLGDYLPELHALVRAELAKLKDEAIRFTRFYTLIYCRDTGLWTSCLFL